MNRSKTVFVLLNFFPFILATVPESNRFYNREVESLCDSLNKSNSLFLPFRCLRPGEDQTKFAKKWLANNKMKRENPPLNPVILIPGFAGSGLRAKLNKTDSPAWYCFRKSDWFRIWLSLAELLVQECWADNLQLNYNASTNKYSNSEGVHVDGIDFGGVQGVDYLDYVFGYPIPLTSMFGTLVKSLKELGYKAGRDLRGVPYDWRLPPDSHLEALFPKLQQLIENTVAMNEGRKVNVITHSLGGPVFVYFLNGMTQEWREKYINKFIPIAGPWAGAPKALRAVISGDDLGINFMDIKIADRHKFRDVARTSGGLLSLLPDPLFFESNRTFVYTKDREYTAWQIGHLLNDIGANSSAKIFENVRWILAGLAPPEVETHCLYGITEFHNSVSLGTNVATEIAYHYTSSKGLFKEPETIDYTANGDGTVPIESLNLCSSWKTKQTQPVFIQEFSLAEHHSILEEENLINFILDLIHK